MITDKEKGEGKKSVEHEVQRTKMIAGGSNAGGSQVISHEGIMSGSQSE